MSQRARVGQPRAGARVVDRPAPSEAEAGAGSGRVPDFFVVGSPKSGTTALYEMLRGHPQIFMPDAKELWYLAEELRFREPPHRGGSARTLEEYVSLFADARPEQRVGEACSLYLWSRTAASAIARLAPDAKIIATLREPASFLRSLHLQLVESYVETESDLRRALGLEAQRREGLSIPANTYWPQTLLYSEHVRYVEQLRRYHAVFPREQVLVLIYDDFRADNESIVRKVLRFLEVDDSAPIETVEVNLTVAVRSQRLHELVHAVSVGRGPLSRALKGVLKSLTPRGLRREALHATQRNVVYRTAPPPDPALMLELRRRYKSEVLALSEYLGRDLVRLWGYDDVG